MIDGDKLKIFFIGGYGKKSERGSVNISKIMKLTNKSGSRKYQRDQTNKLIDSTKDMTILSAEPPSNLEGLAAIAWEKLVPMLNEAGFVKAIDASSVELLCMNIEMYKLAYESIKKDGIQSPIYKTSLSPLTGEVVSKDFTGFKRNPATQIIDSATAKINSLSTLLGLTPASRANLLEAVGSNNEDEQSLSDLLNGNKEDF